MNLEGEDLRAAYYCVAHELRTRRRERLPVPESLRRLHDRLDLHIRCMSESGQAPEPAAGPSEWITATEAGRLLGLSKRQTQRLAADLDGQFVGGRWVFDRSVVAEYAHHRTEHHNDLSGRPGPHQS